MSILSGSQGYTSSHFIPSLIIPLKTVHFIPLPSLNVNRAKKDYFKDDGVHLTARGRAMFLNDLEKGIKAVYTNLKSNFKPIKPEGNKKAGKSGSFQGRMGGDKADSNFQPSGRGFQDESNFRSKPRGGQKYNSGNGYQSDGWQDHKPGVRFMQDGYLSDNRDESKTSNRFQKDGNKSNDWQDNKSRKRVQRAGNGDWQDRNGQYFRPEQRGGDVTRFHPDGRSQPNYSHSQSNRGHNDRRDYNQREFMHDEDRNYMSNNYRHENNRR